MTTGVVEPLVRPSETDLDDLAALLVACVDGGASVGFLAGLDRPAARAWWAEVLADGQPTLVARHGGRVVGCVRLLLAGQPNGRHRAEVAKLLVHPDARRQGLAGLLLDAVDDLAREHGRTLLLLDTETGSPAETLYLARGWQQVGQVPGYAADVDGVLRSTTVMHRPVPPARR